MTIQLYLSRLARAIPHEEEEADLITLILEGEDKIPTIVDCPLSLWYTIRNFLGQWVYWRLDDLGFFLGEATLFETAGVEYHMEYN